MADSGQRTVTDNRASQHRFFWTARSSFVTVRRPLSAVHRGPQK
jgi:hypothetical protein